MEILIYKKPTDQDLKKGQKVCYKNLDGVFCKIGKISDTYLDNGIMHYIINTSFGAYHADELRLVKETRPIKI